MLGYMCPFQFLFWGVYPTVELLGHIAVLFPVFLRNLRKGDRIFDSVEEGKDGIFERIALKYVNYHM